MKTLKNKLYAIGGLLIGAIGAAITKDATVLAVLGLIAVPMFFAKENWIY